MSRRFRHLSRVSAVVILLPITLQATQNATRGAVKKKPSTANRVAECNAIQFSGAVDRGQAFTQSLPYVSKVFVSVPSFTHRLPGLVFRLRPIASGWRIEIVADGAPAAAHDLAEIATPPYASPSPLLLSTDYSFRAQDAAGWSPREFRFLDDWRAQQKLSKDLDTLVAKPDSRGEAEALTTASYYADKGEFRIDRVAFVPGTADIAGTASGVSSRLRFIPQEIRAGKASPLGTLERVEFTVKLRLDAKDYNAPGIQPAKMPCDPPPQAD